MADLNVKVVDGNNINVEVTPVARQVINLDRGVQGVGIVSAAIVFQDPYYFLEFTYTNGTTELVQLPAIAAGVVSFNTRIGVVTLTSLDVTDALGYTPVEPDGTGATGLWSISVDGNAATVTNGVYTTGAYSDPAWLTLLSGAKIVGDIPGNAQNVNGVVAIEHGGTGQTTQNNALNALLPPQISNVGKYLKTDGTDASWDTLDISTADITGTLPVSNGGTGATNLTGYVKGNGTSVMTANPTIPNSDITGLGTISTQNANNVNITGGSIIGITDLAVSDGGTGASTLTGYVKGNGTLAMTASTTIPNTDITGLGTISTQNADNVVITGGSITGITDLAVPDGGTGASSLTGYVIGNGTAAMTASATIPNTDITGLGTLSTQDANNINVTGGSIVGITDLAVTDGGTGTSSLTGYVKGNGTSAMTASTTIPNTDITGLGTSSVLDAGVALGVATLDSGGTVPLTQIPASIQGGLNYQGTWNASTNTPTLTSSVGSKGHYYVVSVAGTTDLNGITDWNIGDLAVFNGSVWEQIDNTDAVTSVNGYTGSVVLDYADVGAPSTTGTDATGTWNINVTGNAATVTNGVYTTDTGTVTNTMLAGSIANNKLVNSSITINGNNTALGGSVNVGTVTSVAATAGTGISVSGSPITTDGTLTITNTAPDQVVSITGAGTSVVTGTYPNFTITSNDEFDGTVTSVSGTGSVNGITLTGTVTDSGSLTLGGTLSNVDLTTQVTGILPIANGGTNANNATTARANLSAAVLGANNDITSMTGVTGGISSPDFVQFDTTGAGTQAIAKMQWDDGNGTLEFGLKGGNVNLALGQEIVARVHNDAGVPLVDGQVVYIAGAQGNRISVKLAKADSETTSAGTLGIVTEPIAVGAEGFIAIMGTVNKLDTSGLTAGALLYLSASTAGAFTATPPVAPNHRVTIGYVERVHNVVGSIYVKVDNGYEIDELHNVKITSPQSGQVLIYDAVEKVWENAGLTAGTGISVTNGAGSITIDNTAPDQVVSLTGTGTTTITGTYPNFTINSEDQFDGTVTSVAATAGTGISISGSPITTSGTLTITNTAPDQVVSITGAGTTTVTGTYPNFTVTSNDQYIGTVTSVAATVPSFLSVSGSPITSSGTLAIGYSGTALPVANGGTGATTLTGYVKGSGTSAMTASSTIPNTDITGLGTMSTQNANSVNITGGTVNATTLQEGGKSVVVQTDIGTAPNQIPLNQYLGSMAYEDNDSVNITGGTLSNVSLSASLPSVISVNSSSDALRITQTGSGNALVVEDSANPDSTPFVIDAVGRVTIGHTSTGFGYPLNIFTDSAFASGMQQYGANANPLVVSLTKTRGATPASSGIVSNNDGIGRIDFTGNDGASYIAAARIDAQVDGTPGASSMPGRLTFSTTADGASSPTERMRIDSAGRVGIGATATASSSFRVARNITGNAFSIGILSDGQIQSDATSRADYFVSAHAAAAGTYSVINGFQAQQSTLTGTVSQQRGFSADASLTGATNNYGFYSNIASGTGRWNFYAAGSAANYFAGSVGIGTPNFRAVGTGGAPNFLIESTSISAAIVGNRDDTVGAVLSLGKSRSATNGSVTIVQNNDILGAIRFAGADGVDLSSYGAQITGEVDGTPGSDDMPGRLMFWTTPDGSASPIERMRIDSSGNVIQTAPTTAPTLNTNGTMVFNLTSNTNLRVSVRGSDGVTRTANITLT